MARGAGPFDRPPTSVSTGGPRGCPSNRAPRGPRGVRLQHVVAWSMTAQIRQIPPQAVPRSEESSCRPRFRSRGWALGRAHAAGTRTCVRRRTRTAAAARDGSPFATVPAPTSAGTSPRTHEGTSWPRRGPPARRTSVPSPPSVPTRLHRSTRDARTVDRRCGGPRPAQLRRRDRAGHAGPPPRASGPSRINRRLRRRGSPLVAVDRGVSPGEGPRRVIAVAAVCRANSASMPARHPWNRSRGVEHITSAPRKYE